MASFDVNVSEINKYTDRLKNNVSEYKLSIDSLKNNLNGIDSSWNDMNTQNFIKIISKESESFLEHISSIKKYIDSIVYFFDSIETELKNKMNIETLAKLSYNSEGLNKQVEFLQKAYNYIDYCVNVMENISFPSSFKYRSILETYYNDLIYYKKNLESFSEKLYDLNVSILNIINNTKTKINKIDFTTINDSEMEYKWKTYSTDLKKIEEENKDNNYDMGTYNMDGSNINNINVNYNVDKNDLKDSDFGKVILDSSKFNEVDIKNRTMSDSIEVSELKNETFSEIETGKKQINDSYKLDDISNINIKNGGKTDYNVNQN